MGKKDGSCPFLFFLWLIWIMASYASGKGKGRSKYEDPEVVDDDYQPQSGRDEEEEEDQQDEDEADEADEVESGNRIKSVNYEEGETPPAPKRARVTKKAARDAKAAAAAKKGKENAAKFLTLKERLTLVRKPSSVAPKIPTSHMFETGSS